MSLPWILFVFAQTRNFNTVVVNIGEISFGVNVYQPFLLYFWVYYDWSFIFNQDKIYLGLCLDFFGKDYCCKSWGNKLCHRRYYCGGTLTDLSLPWILFVFAQTRNFNTVVVNIGEISFGVNVYQPFLLYFWVYYDWSFIFNQDKIYLGLCLDFFGKDYCN